MGSTDSRSITCWRYPVSARQFVWSIVAIGFGTVVFLGVDLARLSASADPAATAAADIVGPVPTKGGALVIGGGGKLPDIVKETFLTLAGGPLKARILYIPTADSNAGGPNDLQYLDDWHRIGTTNIAIFHTRSRDEANDTSFIKPFDDATGVWFGGGRQSLLSEAYVGTEVERALKRVLDRGGVVGGTSAGAAILTKVMIESGRHDAIEGKGFDLLPDSVVDQHFLRRNRMERLKGVLKKHPDLIGIGIDEKTAMVVRDRRITVVGESYVVTCAPETKDRPERIDILKPGDSTDLDKLRGPEKVVVTPGYDFKLSN